MLRLCNESIRRPESRAASGLPPMAYTPPSVGGKRQRQLGNQRHHQHDDNDGRHLPQRAKGAGIVPSAISPLGSTMFSVIEPP